MAIWLAPIWFVFGEGNARSRFRKYSLQRGQAASVEAAATNLMIDQTGARLWYGQPRASGRSAIARNAFASSILAAMVSGPHDARPARLELWSRLGQGYPYTVLVGKITVSVDNEVLAAVHRYATERNSTVNDLVPEYLTNLAAQDSRAKRARVRLRQLSWESQGSLGRKKWSREALYHC
jgi:hypothetical protein